MRQRSQKLGLWLVGACGNVAATVAVGLAALVKRRTPPVGLWTERPECAALPLVPLAGITLGGHDLRGRRVTDTVRRLRERSGLFNEAMLRAARPAVAAYQRAIRPGTAVGCGRTVARLAGGGAEPAGRTGRAIIDALRRDLYNFRRRNRLDRVVVINVASTEPIFKHSTAHADWVRLAAALKRSRHPPLPASSLYAIAAIEESMPYVNFTPSLGADVPAIRELADARGVPIMGRDGKTGETLVKSVLAPMFRDRALDVLSWTGHNILGNLDGHVLADPGHKAAKLRTKGNVIRSIVGGDVATHVSIEYVASLHDWKIAWDHVHFRGFLGTPMSLQFTWQGADSILAAPLVLDLARLADFHAAAGGTGVMAHLACFFKSPMDVAARDFPTQVEMLRRYVAAHTPARSRRAPEARR
ncbi:MAG: inositol-3-phosphate synthase [Phycisphaerae bacterium]